MKISLWRWIRRWWHVHLHSLTRAAAEDLMDGIDLGDHDCGFSAWPRFEAPEPMRNAKCKMRNEAGKRP